MTLIQSQPSAPDRPRRSAPGRSKRVPVSRVSYLVIAVMTVLYAPMAISYMWFLFSPHAPQLQDALTTAINGEDYATGRYSVHWARDADYAAARWAMLVHTTLGGVALTLSMLQFSSQIRTRRIAFHRWLGRLYFALMTVSMVAAIVYLLGVTPIAFIGGTGFQAQLWLLAMGTLTSGYYALWAIRRRDVVTHRAWITLNISFMLTAPLLRVFWVLLAPLRPEFALLINLGLGSVVLAVLAPGGGVVAFMLSQRTRARGEARSQRVRRYVAAVTLAAIGSTAVIVQYAAIGTSGLPGFPVDGVVLALASAWGLVAVCLIGALRAARAGDWTREGQWSSFLIGAGLAPIGAAGVAIAAIPLTDTANALVAGLMTGPSGPIVIAFAIVVHQSRRRLKVKPAASAATDAGTRHEPVGPGAANRRQP